MIFGNGTGPNNLTQMRHKSRKTSSPRRHLDVLSFLSSKFVGGLKGRDHLSFTTIFRSNCLGFSPNKSINENTWFFVGFLLPAMTLMLVTKRSSLQLLILSAGSQFVTIICKRMGALGHSP